jgi:hypothetical protein
MYSPPIHIVSSSLTPFHAGQGNSLTRAQSRCACRDVSSSASGVEPELPNMVRL